LGIISAMIPLGAICATPLISTVGDRYGRKKGIFLGSLVMASGGIIQGASVHSEYIFSSSESRACH
jgi:MFS family permease